MTGGGGRKTEDGRHAAVAWLDEMLPGSATVRYLLQSSSARAAYGSFRDFANMFGCSACRNPTCGETGSRGRIEALFHSRFKGKCSYEYTMQSEVHPEKMKSFGTQTACFLLSASFLRTPARVTSRRAFDNEAGPNTHAVAICGGPGDLDFSRGG